MDDLFNEPDGVLPSLGERPVFGRHRLPARERWCPAWPVNPKLIADIHYRAMLNRERKRMHTIDN